MADISSLLAHLVKPVIDQLPQGSALPIPDLSSVGQTLGSINDLVPVGPVLSCALGLLALLVVFIALRVVIVVWHLIYP